MSFALRGLLDGDFALLWCIICAKFHEPLASSLVTTKTTSINQLIRQLEHYMSLYGYETQQVPIIDNADLFLTKAGDQIIERLFMFERRGQQWALRPEFTASATYQYISSHETSIKRWQYQGAVFEDQRNQQKNSYQHHSVGAELFGAGDINADAEIISMATQGIIRLGINDWQLTIGHTGLMRQILKNFNLDDRTFRFLLSNRETLRQEGKYSVIKQLEQYLPNINTEAPNDIELSKTVDEADTHEMVDTFLDASRGRNTMGGRSRNDITRRILKKRQQATQKHQIIDAINFLESWVHLEGNPREILDQLEQLITGISDGTTRLGLLSDLNLLLDLLEIYNVPLKNIRLKPDLAREWEYYTGIVFEITSSAGDLLCGGGRYDDLSRLLGGQDIIPAIGFAYNVDNLNKHVLQSNHKIIHELRYKELQSKEAIQWVSLLRDKYELPVKLTIVDENYQDADTDSLQITEDSMMKYQGKSYKQSDIQELVERLS